jgi:hypothetical protein
VGLFGNGAGLSGADVEVSGDVMGEATGEGAGEATVAPA